MRRSILILSAFTSLALVACEDGPTQTFSPAPAGAANNWNNSDAGPIVSGATQGFVGSNTGGATKITLCTGDQLAKRWGIMVTEPIVPPSIVAGVDESGGESWQGLTIDQAELVNCQSGSAGDYFGDGNLDAYWGDNEEVVMEYLISTRKIIGATMNPGYTGGLGCDGNEPKDSPSGPCQPLMSRDKMHTYFIPINSQIQKDGKAFELDWTDPVKFPVEANELVDALFATYAPAFPAETNCIGNGHCISNNFGDVAYLYTPALGQAIWVPSINAPQPTPSILYRIDQDLAKVMPYSYANPRMSLDTIGPVAIAGTLGKASMPCQLGMGQTYQQFLSTCVQVSGDTKADQDSLNKLLGGLSHGAETFTFDVQGVDIDFKSAALAADDVLHDNQVPTMTDTATEFSLDQSTLGNILNDYADAAGTVLDLHGAGAVYKEYRRLVIQDLLALSGTAAGDPAKCLLTDTVAEGTDPGSWVNSLPAYCTGFEGMISAAAPLAGDLGVNVGTGSCVGTLCTAGAQGINSGYVQGLKGGITQIAFCADPAGPIADIGSETATGYNLCGAGEDPGFGAQGNIFSTSFARAIQVFGKGALKNLPSSVQDVRFFWKEYVTALLKYMTLGTMPAAMLPASLQNVTLDTNALFFDSIGAGQFEQAEYVDRRFVTMNQPPLDVVISADVKDGIFNGYDFTRYLARGEKIIYTVMTAKAGDALGLEDTALITNVFGSPVLAQTWTPGVTSSTVLECATDPSKQDCPVGVPLDATGNPATDDNGNPLLSLYPGALAGSATSLALGPSGMKVSTANCAATDAPANDAADACNFIQSAFTTVPVYTNPYDPKSVPIPPITELLPWAPKQAGVGFNIPLTGTTNQFVESSTVDFTGTTLSASVYYDCVTDTTGACKADGSLQIEGVVSTDFLGKVFLCYDPPSGSLLTAEMYTPVGDILDWIAGHPGTYDSCSIVIRYSPFNNYADYITSQSAGVTLEVTQGGGFGRIVGAVLFTPGQMGQGQ